MLIFSLYAGGGYAASIDLVEWAMNVDGVIDNSVANIDDFDLATGLGTVSTKVTGAGDHFVGFFFDHEIIEQGNSYFNESGSANGVLATGQSWEIDEPSSQDGSQRNGDGNKPYFGDVYYNLADSGPSVSYLDNQIFYDWIDDQSLVNSDLSTPVKDDVSVAMGWNFNLGLDETVIISLFVSIDQPESGFYLAHNDLDSGDSIFFSSSIALIPAPATLILVLIGFLGIVRHKRLIVS